MSRNNPNPPEIEQIERLISRYLDDEATREDRKALDVLRRDPHCDALFHEYCAIDREVGVALRGALGRSAGRRVTLGWVWAHVGGLAAAACLAVVVWLAPARRVTDSDVSHAGLHSWFAPLPVAGDSLGALPPESYTPGVLYTQDAAPARWIVAPGDRPGEFLVIQVREVTTRAVPLRGDF